MLVPLATAGVLVLTGPQLVTSTRSLGHDVWDQLNGGTASSACAPGGRPAAQVKAHRTGAKPRAQARKKAAARAKARTPALADSPTC